MVEVIVALAGGAVLSVVGWAARRVVAQIDRLGVTVATLERRVSAMTGQIDHRMTVVETTIGIPRPQLVPRQSGG